MNRNEFGSVTLVIACILTFCWVSHVLRWWLGDEAIFPILAGAAVAALGTALVPWLCLRLLRRSGGGNRSVTREQALQAERQREEVVPLFRRLLRIGFQAQEEDARFASRVEKAIEAPTDAEAEAMLVRTGPHPDDGWPAMREDRLRALLSVYVRRGERITDTRLLLRRLQDDLKRRANHDNRSLPGSE